MYISKRVLFLLGILIPLLIFTAFTEGVLTEYDRPKSWVEINRLMEEATNKRKSLSLELELEPRDRGPVLRLRIFTF